MKNNAFDGKTFAKSLSGLPGVYQMFDAKNKCLYVGKAANLKKRVSSYFSGKPLTAKLILMLNKVSHMDVVVTSSEAQALLLESNLIKKLKPRYNIQLKDDKSYPYIYLDDAHAFPRLGFYRGTRKIKGKLYGPYPSAKSVRETLSLLQKVFPVRQCKNSYYENRSRPCLQYQIKRCPAPCVGLIDIDKYQKNVALVKYFLEGKSDEVINLFQKQIFDYSGQLEFEQAAIYRDKLLKIQQIYQNQGSAKKQFNLDVLAIAEVEFNICISVTFIRSGRLVGTRYHTISNKLDLTESELLESFIAQYYSSHDVPSELIVNQKIKKRHLLATALSEIANKNVVVKDVVRTQRLKWLTHGYDNTVEHLRLNARSNNRYKQMYKAFSMALELQKPPQIIECFDISHSQGESTIASCVVFNSEGPVKSSYRRYNIENITAADDYAALEQVVERRYTKNKAENRQYADVILVDGGIGQLNRVEDTIKSLNIEGIVIAGVAKGEGRKAGLEKLILNEPNNKILHFSRLDPALHLIQQIRDEAHRFAITGHRNKRAKTRLTSSLESIAGIGKKRRTALLNYFGGIQGIKRAGVDDLKNVDGISHELASQIFQHFH